MPERFTFRDGERLIRFGEADVPPSGKIIKCTSCGEPVTVMPDAGGRPAAPGRATAFGLGPQVKPAAPDAGFPVESTSELGMMDLDELSADPSPLGGLDLERGEGLVVVERWGRAGDRHSRDSSSS